MWTPNRVKTIVQIHSRRFSYNSRKWFAQWMRHAICCGPACKSWNVSWRVDIKRIFDITISIDMSAVMGFHNWLWMLKFISFHTWLYHSISNLWAACECILLFNVNEREHKTREYFCTMSMLSVTVKGTCFVYRMVFLFLKVFSFFLFCRLWHFSCSFISFNQNTFELMNRDGEKRTLQ